MARQEGKRVGTVHGPPASSLLGHGGVAVLSLTAPLRRGAGKLPPLLLLSSPHHRLSAPLSMFPSFNALQLPLQWNGLHWNSLH